MFVYWLTRRRFVKSFEETDDGYIFRSYPWSEAYLVSEKEKGDLLRKFPRKYVKYHALLWASAFAAIICASILAVATDSTDFKSPVMNGIGWGFAFALLGGIFAIGHRIRTLPKRELNDRAPTLEPRGLKGAFIASTAKLSWTNIMIWLASIVGLGWLFFPANGAAGWVWILWIAYFALCAASLALHIYAKVNLSTDQG